MIELKQVFCEPQTEGEWKAIHESGVYNTAYENLPYDDMMGMVNDYGWSKVADGYVRPTGKPLLENYNLTEVSVEVFLDLYLDRIAKWRFGRIGVRDRRTR